MTPDEERLRRYLEWRRAGDRERAQRRRRAIGYVAVPAVGVVAVGLAVWLGRPPSDSSSVGAAIPVVPRASAPSPSAPDSDPAASASSPAPALPPRTPPVASRPRVRPEPPSRLEEGVTEPDVAAAVAPAAPAPVSSPPELPGDVPSEPRRDAVPAAPREAPSAEPLPVPAPSDVVQDSPVPDPPPAPPTLSGGAVAVAPPTARERVTRWAQGEVQEFRDGVKREVHEFRSGYEKVRDFFRR